MQRSGQGFSLIEMVVTVAIIGVLLALGVPRFAEYLRNVKLRAAAEMFLASMQLTRSEAVRMNTPVEFLLTTTDPLPANVGTAAASVSGSNWLVRTADMGTFIDGKFGIEGSGRGTGQVTAIKINDTSAPANIDPDAPPAAPISSIVFNGLGRTSLANQAVFKFNNPNAGTCVTAGGPVRCLKVIVAIGGQARLCDPAIGAAAVAAGDSRGC
ncbi:MAG: prepilin-type N-terminal cleavage/methylation domain-containing protein [Rugosibacter sp.]|nr:MAG: prepilin-type N-terminal cleavage/methylation domain-containing protein [Rugosibacter sp.]TBR07054.1 MAG: prepilin-type N-terminal cleavage/methylation domain-containing protein [Rugosibacter sp.]